MNGTYYPNAYCGDPSISCPGTGESILPVDDHAVPGTGESVLPVDDAVTTTDTRGKAHTASSAIASATTKSANGKSDTSFLSTEAGDGDGGGSDVQ